ncbi:MAG TPA: YiiD C-terminal domain-containing protein [Gammaproteobacteria bacterium]|nr:YiiD C-terminal domain-containing protein [Gammaproteobacteria bacterium]
MGRARELEQTLHELVPLSDAMGVAVERVSDDGIVLTAPLSANHNHAGTAFGGSLYSLACLAGWAWLRAGLADRGLRPMLVIAEGTMRYLRPAHEDALRAVLRAEPETLDGIAIRLRTGRRARVDLDVHLPDDSDPVAVLTARFAALPPAEADAAREKAR